jgi:hypothetical protein
MDRRASSGELGAATPYFPRVSLPPFSLIQPGPIQTPAVPHELSVISSRESLDVVAQREEARCMADIHRGGILLQPGNDFSQQGTQLIFIVLRRRCSQERVHFLVVGGCPGVRSLLLLSES